jgi:hypothetical protein
MPPVPRLPRLLALHRTAASPRYVSVETLNVAPELVGRPLATPQRLAAALAVDLLVVALLSAASGYWLALALLLLAAQLRRALGQEGARRFVTAVLLAVVVAAAAWVAWDAWRSGERPTAPKREPLPELAEDATDAQRLERAEAELRRVRAELKRRTLADQVEATLDEIGASFGWGIVYFSLLPAWWRGQTLGKRLFGLRIVELTGQPITPLRGLKRYGGYAAGMATGGLGFLQVLWEPNRQGLQDKAAHTVVLDERTPPPVD